MSRERRRWVASDVTGSPSSRIPAASRASGRSTSTSTRCSLRTRTTTACTRRDLSTSEAPSYSTCGEGTGRRGLLALPGQSLLAPAGRGGCHRPPRPVPERRPRGPGRRHGHGGPFSQVKLANEALTTSADTPSAPRSGAAGTETSLCAGPDGSGGTVKSQHDRAGHHQGMSSRSNRPITPDRVAWLEVEMVNTRVAHDAALTTQSQDRVRTSTSVSRPTTTSPHRSSPTRRGSVGRSRCSLRDAEVRAWTGEAARHLESHPTSNTTLVGSRPDSETAGGLDICSGPVDRPWHA